MAKVVQFAFNPISSQMAVLLDDGKLFVDQKSSWLEIKLPACTEPGRPASNQQEGRRKGKEEF